MRPCTRENDPATDSVILRVDIEESVRGNIASGWVAANRADVMHPKACTIVALVGQTVNNVQVVIDALVVDGEESSGRLRVAQIAKVNDMRYRTS